MIRLLNNNVLLRLPKNEVFKDKISIAGGHTLFIPTDPNEPRNTINPRWEVAGIPEKLVYKEKLRVKIDLDHKIPIEIRCGDYVYVIYSQLLESLGDKASKLRENHNPTWYEEDGYIYIIVKYIRLILVERGNTILPLNGKLICEVLDKDFKSDKLILPDIYKQDKKKVARAIVISKGSDATERYNFKTQKWNHLYTYPIKEGTVIFFQNGMQSNIDYSINEKRDLVFIESVHVMGWEV